VEKNNCWQRYGRCYWGRSLQRAYRNWEILSGTGEEQNGRCMIEIQNQQRAHYFRFDHDGWRDAFRDGPYHSEAMVGVEKCGEHRRRRRLGCRFDVGVVSDALCQEEVHLGCKGRWLHPSAREPTRDSDAGCLLHEPSHASSRDSGATTPHGVPSGVSRPNLGRRNVSTAPQGGRNSCRVACKISSTFDLTLRLHEPQARLVGCSNPCRLPQRSGTVEKRAVLPAS
jgi:hypothetical protein